MAGFFQKGEPNSEPSGLHRGLPHLDALYFPSAPPYLGWGILSESPQSVLEFFLSPTEDNAFET